MSLKAVHLIFITVATLFAVGFAVWCIQRFNATGDGGMMGAGIVSALAAVSLVIYAIQFLKKLKHVPYL